MRNMDSSTTLNREGAGRCGPTRLACQISIHADLGSGADETVYRTAGSGGPALPNARGSIKIESPATFHCGRVILPTISRRVSFGVRRESRMASDAGEGPDARSARNDPARVRGGEILSQGTTNAHPVQRCPDHTLPMPLFRLVTDRRDTLSHGR